MEQLNFPEYQFKVKSDTKGTQIFDIVRKKFVVLTPEEWVRQHAIHFLHLDKGYPLGLMGVEKEIKVNRLPKRFDLVCFDNLGAPSMVCEFKRPTVAISEATFMQVANYNVVLTAPYLYVTNGLKHYMAEIDFQQRKHHFLKEIPDYNQL